LDYSVRTPLFFPFIHLKVYSLRTTHLFSSAAPKVMDHMIPTYRLSLMRAIKLQVSRWKGEEEEEARELARGLDLNKALLGVHLSESELENSDLVPMTLEQMQKDKESRGNSERRNKRRSGQLESRSQSGEIAAKEI